jgi:hypothetical protein
MVLAMYPLYAFIPPSSTAILQLARVGILLVAGITTYLGIVLTLDREARVMIKLLFKRLNS